MNSPAASVRARRALEALRAGVPNRDAVVELGSMQVGVEDRFAEILDDVGRDGRGEPSAASLVTSTARPGGRAAMIGGGFGSGKSHLLEHLANIALSEGFVVSKVTISKETPLHDPAKVFRAAIEEARVPGRHGSAIDEIAIAIQFNSDHYRNLYRWVHQDNAPVSQQFPATLYLYEYARGDDELRDRLLRFWAGDKLSVTDIRRRLRELGAAGSYKVTTVREADLSRQRFRFVSRLARAAGHRGWIILFDEVELIGRYTIGQRAKSYVEIARWIKGDRDDPDAPIGAVMATVDDYESQVLNEKNDPALVPARFRALGTEAGDVEASLAEIGMRIIGHELMKLQPPAQDELDRTYARLKEIHGEAFAWEPPDVVGLERLPSNRMRQYVRAWINEWDLVRLDPTYVPEIEAELIEVDLREDPTLEDEPPEGDGYGYGPSESTDGFDDGERVDLPDPPDDLDGDNGADLFAEPDGSSPE
jgi:hypothetical protein